MCGNEKENKSVLSFLFNRIEGIAGSAFYKGNNSSFIAQLYDQNPILYYGSLPNRPTPEDYVNNDSIGRMSAMTQTSLSLLPCNEWLNNFLLTFCLKVNKISVCGYYSRNNASNVGFFSNLFTMDVFEGNSIFNQLQQHIQLQSTNNPFFNVWGMSGSSINATMNFESDVNLLLRSGFSFIASHTDGSNNMFNFYGSVLVNFHIADIVPVSRLFGNCDKQIETLIAGKQSSEIEQMANEQMKFFTDNFQKSI